MFRATMCPSSGETTVSMRHLVFVTLCFGRLCAHHQEKQLYLCDTWYLSLCVSGDYVPIIRRNNCIYATLGIFHSVFRATMCPSSGETTVSMRHLAFVILCFGRLCAHHQEKQLYLCDPWYLSLCVSGDYVPIIRRNNCIYATLGICHSVFRATICPSSGETTVSMRYLVFVTLCFG